jgi:4-amino-4-deoxy-L-arabinose transferase-like glycosyltransferase
VTDASPPAHDPHSLSAICCKWSAFHSLLSLTLLTLACLLPFLGKAFHMDDPLFIWTAQHIAQHPLDPYGFRVVWYATETPIADVVKNPPLASYYLAWSGRIFGWGESALHLALLFPALIVILGTYRLAARFTRWPLLAALATLFSPGFLVSSTTVMCDILMLALWMLALVFWLEAENSGQHWQFALAAIFIAACALTKYFGIALLPLLLAYSLSKRRRIAVSIAYLAIPVLLLALYQHWTRGLYGRGLLSDAIQYASLHNRGHELSFPAKTLLGLVFTGGCALPALFLSPQLWKRRSIFATVAVAIAAGLAISGHQAWFETPRASAVWTAVSAQMALWIAGGLSAVGVALISLRKITPERLLLSLWAGGTFFFAAYLNWTINARSVLPMIPAAAILVACLLERRKTAPTPRSLALTGAALLAAAVVSIWVTRADANLANAGRTAAAQLSRQVGPSHAAVYFEGHWGFQYYLQQSGARPADLRNSPFHAGDVLIIPENTTNSFGPPPGFVLAEVRMVELPLAGGIATMSEPAGAGFYASVWGPLPFAFGRVPPERYLVARLTPDAKLPLVFKPQ